jgi:hypothetical protein
VSRFFTNTPNVASFTATSGIAAPGVAGSAFGLTAASNAALQQDFGSGATLAQLQASVPGFALPNLSTQANQFNISRYLEWNFEVQRELTRYLTLTENYVGNHGWDEINQNPYLNTYSTTGFGGLPTAPADKRFGDINQLDSTARSNYDGLVTSVKYRLGASLIGAFNYSWSHALDMCSNNCLGRFNLLNAPSLRYQLNPAGPAAQNYGNADYDTRHSLNANYVWSIPTHFKSHLVDGVLGHWAVSGTFFYHSGYPFSVINSSLRSTYIKNSSGLATVTVLPDYLGGPSTCSSPDGTCFSASEFLPKSQQTNFGNLSRN